jgi:hypothetical protein
MTEIRTTGGECKDDIAKFCASTPHTKGMLAKCLEEHHDQLGDACKALSSKARGAASAAPVPAGGAAAAPAAAATTAPAAPAGAAPAPKPASAPGDAGKK